MDEKATDLKTILFGSINRRLTLFFFIVGIVAPTIAVSYFYSIATSILSQFPEVLNTESLMILETTAILIIILIAVDAAIIGLLISKSITKPIQHLHHATQELQKGNFSVRTTITTNDELEQLSNAFNKTTLALQKMDEEQKQLDKAKSDFISITSHELRTPLTPLKAQLQMIENNYFGPLTTKQKESMNIILRNVERLNILIEDFLEISRIETARLRFNFTKVHIPETIHDAVSLMQGFAHEKNITITVHTESVPLIRADSNRITQILRNIIHNAIKFSPPHSEIQVSAQLKDTFILFSVKDQGGGLPSEEQIQIFEPFYQTQPLLSREYGGTGLGLAICRGIVEAQHGKIWVQSTVGKGSTFFFTVPITPIEDIKPIKVLFSKQHEYETKIQKQFTTILGPMGLVEFDELRNKNALSKPDIMNYINRLDYKKIITSQQAATFKQNIEKLFGQEHDATPEKNNSPEHTPHREEKPS